MLNVENTMLKNQSMAESDSARTCTFCDVLFKDVKSLQKHVAEQHTTKQCAYLCHFCRFVFSFANELQDLNRTLATHGLESQVLPFLH